MSSQTMLPIHLPSQPQVYHWSTSQLLQVLDQCGDSGIRIQTGWGQPLCADEVRKCSAGASLFSFLFLSSFPLPPRSHTSVHAKMTMQHPKNKWQCDTLARPVKNPHKR